MHRQTQGQGRYGGKAASGVADWQALEVQLTRTRLMLQEILVHLQEVLHNLRQARTSGPTTTARPEAGASRFSTRDTRHRTQTPPPNSGADRSSRTQAHGATTGQASAGASEHNRFKARPHFEAKAQAAGSAQSHAAGSRPSAAGEDKARSGPTGTTRPGAASFRTHAAHAGTHRERPRQEATFRAKPTGPGPEREAGSRTAGQQQSRASAGASQGASKNTATGQTAGFTARPQARPRPERTAERFRPDRDRQHRAREVARRSGMNLKCAYDILCLDYPCSIDEIKNAYRHMARMHHPDLGGDEEAMKDVNVAYELAMRFSAGRRTATAWAV
ncbi:J domain-containing protein [Solidesulfovibrio sp.]